MSEETKRKISEARKGQRHSEETKAKIAETGRARKFSLSHRYNIAQARLGYQHTAETKRKIANSEKATKRALRRERLALRAAAAAEAATADLRPAFSSRESSVGEDEYEEEPPLLDSLELEKAVIEMVSLRRQLGAWMDWQEQKHGRKPDLTEASETHPFVYAKFVRYVALRELVRRSTLAIGQTPASWQWE